MFQCWIVILLPIGEILFAQIANTIVLVADCGLVEETGSGKLCTVRYGLAPSGLYIPFRLISPGGAMSTGRPSSLRLMIVVSGGQL